MILRLFSALLFISMPAHAASLCHSLSEVKGMASSCRQNKIFSEAAEICIGRIDAAIKVQQALLAQSMALTNGATTQSQAARVENNQFNVQNTAANLASLEAQALAARGAMAEYSQNFTMPGGIKAEEAKSLGPSSMFEKYPCFAGNQNKLGSQIDQMDKKILELDSAKKQAESLGASSQSILGRLQEKESSAPTSQALENEKREPAAAAANHKDVDLNALFGGDSLRPESGISGKTEEEKKR